MPKIGLDYIAYFILFCLGITVGVFLILALVNLIRLIKKLNVILDENQKNLHSTLAQLPKTVENVNAVASDIRGGIQKAGDTAEGIGEMFTHVAATMDEKAEKLYTLAGFVSDGGKFLLDILSKLLDKKK